MRPSKRSQSLALRVRAPAKVNLVLRVVGKRRDGYHLLECLTAPISLFDDVALRPTTGNSIRLLTDDATLSNGPANLAWRAAFLLKEMARVNEGVAIRLRKRIPAGAGLGGGSSDAAAVLVGLNRLWGLGLSSASLARLGARVGADVPFFVHGRPAVVGGIGEKVQPCRAFPTAHLTLAWPGVPMSTKWVFQNLAFRKRGRRRPPLRILLRGDTPLASILENDLEATAAAALPDIRTLRADLGRAGALGTAMTGSGSAVFGLFASRGLARRAATTIRRRGLWTASVRTLAAPSSL